MVEQGVTPTGTDASLGQTKALTHGLEILHLLVEANRPMTATEIAKAIGLHQSSASRILKTLIAAGYVRKPDYHSFAPDLGVLALGGTAIRNFPLANKPRPAMAALAERAHGLTVSLATFWRGEMLYLLRTQAGHEPVGFFAGHFPLHLSSPALRMLLEMPEAGALAHLEASRARYGWERPGAMAPASPEAALAEARGLLRHDGLVLDGWQGPCRVSAAIPLAVPGVGQAALALSGPGEAATHDEILLLLQEGRRAVEAAMR
ncbi:MAG: helix-turn-helix domain-containing protein [Planctomycetota bacterium]|nr:helix-turn-helix domain-containing protein [Planctomycetota bacterium]